MGIWRMRYCYGIQFPIGISTLFKQKDASAMVAYEQIEGQPGRGLCG
jgi:hypothetical protein